MKKNIILFFFLANYTIFAQNFTAEYQEIWQNYKVTDFLLQRDNNVSLWFVQPENYRSQIKDTTINIQGTKYHTYEAMRISSPVYDNYSYKRFVLKDFNKNRVIFTKIHKDKRIFIKDSLQNMKWEFGNEHKYIQGYNCQSATTTFRGRTYKAFFAPDIPVNDGPWKFCGLPGLIMDIKSKDGEYAFRINHIERNEQEKIKLPDYKEQELWSWQKYKETIVKYYDDKIAYARAKHRESGKNSGGSIKISGIEVIHPIFSPAGVSLYEMKKN